MKMERRNKTLVILKDGKVITKAKSQTEASKFIGCSIGLVNQCLNGRVKGALGYKVMLETDYNNQEEETKEIMKRKETMYYVNVLVGLANGTLIDGAIYYVGGNKLVYRREKQCLVLFGNEEVSMLSREDVLAECKVEYPLLEEKERLFLSNLIKAFRDAKGITKCKYGNGFEYIKILMPNSSEDLVLPNFKENQYYKNLQVGKLYSLEDLDI